LVRISFRCSAEMGQEQTLKNNELLLLLLLLLNLMV
jgi:hypothetical protein